MGRRERQREQILAAWQRGELARVLVLSRQHLAEFPDDEDVRRAAEAAAPAGADGEPDDAR